VHTSAKARLTRFRIRIRDPHRHQNLTACSMANRQPSLKTSFKSVQKCLCKVATRWNVAEIFGVKKLEAFPFRVV